MIVLLAYLAPMVSNAQRLSIDTALGNQKYLSAKKLILPGTLILYGFSALKFKPLIMKNEKLQSSLATPSRSTKIDSYLQFAPAITSLGLSVAGVEGKHTTGQQAILVVSANLVNTILAQSVKHITRELRPDSSARTSFPSGHTSTAFCGAELLRMEYGKKYPLLAVGGYLAAATTGYLRIYNNKHWFSDVVAGAGFGILSTRISYAVLQKPFMKKAASKGVVVLPYYNQKTIGFACIKHW